MLCEVDSQVSHQVGVSVVDTDWILASMLGLRLPSKSLTVHQAQLQLTWACGPLWQGEFSGEVRRVYQDKTGQDLHVWRGGFSQEQECQLCVWEKNESHSSVPPYVSLPSLSLPRSLWEPQRKSALCPWLATTSWLLYRTWAWWRRNTGRWGQWITLGFCYVMGSAWSRKNGICWWDGRRTQLRVLRVCPFRPILKAT